MSEWARWTISTEGQWPAGCKLIVTIGDIGQVTQISSDTNKTELNYSSLIISAFSNISETLLLSTITTAVSKSWHEREVKKLAENYTNLIQKICLFI